MYPNITKQKHQRQQQGQVQVSKEEKFDTKEYDVTGCCALYCCCGKTTLVLEQDTVSIQSTDCWSKSDSEVAYGEVGNVNQTTTCFGCTAISGDFLPNAGGDSAEAALSPGCGCEGDLVNDIVKEIRRRVRLRGDIAIHQRAEEQARNIKVLSDQVQSLEHKLDAIMNHLKVPQTASMERS